jgi:hypothetical protein
MTVRDDVQHVAALLARPRSGYARRVEAAQSALSPQACEALRQLGMFVDRVGDLSTDELRELYDETFRRGRPATTTRAKPCSSSRRCSSAWTRTAILLPTSSAPSAVVCSTVPAPGDPELPYAPDVIGSNG